MLENSKDDMKAAMMDVFEQVGKLVGVMGFERVVKMGFGEAVL